MTLRSARGEVARAVEAARAAATAAGPSGDGMRRARFGWARSLLLRASTDPSASDFETRTQDKLAPTA